MYYTNYTNYTIYYTVPYLAIGHAVALGAFPQIKYVLTNLIGMLRCLHNLN